MTLQNVFLSEVIKMTLNKNIQTSIPVPPCFKDICLKQVIVFNHIKNKGQPIEPLIIDYFEQLLAILDNGEQKTHIIHSKNVDNNYYQIYRMYNAIEIYHPIKHEPKFKQVINKITLHYIFSNIITDDVYDGFIKIDDYINIIDDYTFNNDDQLYEFILYEPFVDFLTQLILEEKNNKSLKKNYIKSTIQDVIENKSKPIEETIFI